ncbi:hypothetical protein C7477_11095 [Phyllobacterium leguminum]|uniref:Uncharacterized protein n=1 Tax=Phyllobacterium leguminum TaxID=314237 RepID=A0A318T4P0_9HYPH|nr:hypothetical protein C7477_11095 [Phyllobacterium leguminum]
MGGRKELICMSIRIQCNQSYGLPCQEIIICLRLYHSTAFHYASYPGGWLASYSDWRKKARLEYDPEKLQTSR